MILQANRFCRFESMKIDNFQKMTFLTEKNFSKIIFESEIILKNFLANLENH